MRISTLLLFFTFFIASVNAATITSTSTGGNWTAGATWVGGVAPTSSDEVVIAGPVSINASVACVKITINSGKTLSFATGGYTLTLTNSWQTVFTNSGTFTAGDGTVKFVSSNNGLTVSGTVTFNNVIIDNVDQMNMGGNATVNGTLKLINGSNFGYNNNNHPVYGSAATLDINGTYTPSTNPIIWATDNSNKTAPNIVISGGTVTASQGSLYLKGTLTVASGATFNGAGGCTYMVSGFQRITNNGTITLGGVTVKTGAVWNVNSNFNLATLRIESGGTVNANSYTLNLNNSTINNCGGISGIMQLETGGVFNAGTSTVVFVPAFYSNVTADVSGPINFTNMVVSGSSPINIPVDNTVTVAGNVTVNSGATVSNPGNIVFDSSATVTNNGNTSGETFPPTVPTTPVSSTYLSGTISGNKAGAASIQSNTTAILSGNININSGTSKTLTIAPSAELIMGTYTVTVDTLYVYGKLTISNTGGLAAAFLRSSGSTVIKLGSGSTITYDAAASQTITQRSDYVNLKLSGSGTKIFAAGTYTIGGDFTSEGGSIDIATNSPVFTFNGENNQAIKGLPYSSLNFAGTGTKTLSDSASVTGVVSLSGSAELVSNGLLTLKSNAAGTASIGQISGTATITGNINYERYIPAGRLWRFIGWPISGNTFANSWQNQVYITGPGTGGSIGTTNSNGYDYTATNAPGLYYYNETSTAGIDAKWTTVTNTSTSISSTTGYRLFVRGARSQGTIQLTSTSYTPLPVTLTGTGAPNKGDISVSLTCSNGCGSANGWHLLANPYPSAIDWNNTTWKAARNANINSTIYVYNPALNKYGAWSPTGGSVNSGSSNIASGQSFYVKTNGAATLTFKEQYKVTNATVGLFGKSSGVVDNLKLQIGDNTKIYDETVVYMYASATQTLDQDLDAVKPDVTNASISTYMPADTNKLIFNAIPELVNGDSAIILLHVPLANATYTYNLSFVGTETFANSSTQFILIDTYTNSTFVISQLSPVYSFSTTANTAASYASNRFQLKITTATGSLPVKLVSFHGEKYNGTSILKWTTASELNNDHFDVQRSNDGLHYTTIGTLSGAKYSSKPVSYQFTDKEPADGVNYYRLKQVDGDGKETYSTVITLNFGKEGAKVGVTAWPVPADDYLTIELNNTEIVNASIVIRDMVGKVVYTENILADESGYSHPIWVENLQTGVYFIEIQQGNQAVESVKFTKK
jgi:hypothetical protein